MRVGTRWAGVVVLALGVVSACSGDSEGTPPGGSGGAAGRDGGASSGGAGADTGGAAGTDGGAGSSGAAGTAPEVSVAQAQEICAAHEAKLRDCKLLTDGPYHCDPIVRPSDVCRTKCVTDASCDALRDWHCGDPISATISNCLGTCNEKVRFTCDDGTTVPDAYRCDGEDDCRDGADEVCPTGGFFSCGDGVGIHQGLACEGNSDCPTGSDEDKCGDFKCEDGSNIDLARTCDGEPDCTGGGDEEGCPPRAEYICPPKPPFKCDDGTEIPREWVCNGEEDCPLGEDEICI